MSHFFDTYLNKRIFRFRFLIVLVGLVIYIVNITKTSKILPF